jgi:ABC-type dipeptide/oligopeptide/nickel transport system ATPase component
MANGPLLKLKLPARMTTQMESDQGATKPLPGIKIDLEPDEKIRLLGNSGNSQSS